jgi:hypothetical protein
MRAERPRFLSRHDVAVAVPLVITDTDDHAGAPESGVHAVDDVVHGHDGGAMASLVEQVTLVVYGWKNVEPGTLSWVFPSLTTALAAARTMTNASRWSIVAGRRDAEVDVDEERSHGAVLVEQAS